MNYTYNMIPVKPALIQIMASDFLINLSMLSDESAETSNLSPVV